MVAAVLPEAQVLLGTRRGNAGVDLQDGSPASAPPTSTYT